MFNNAARLLDVLIGSVEGKILHVGFVRSNEGFLMKLPFGVLRIVFLQSHEVIQGGLRFSGDVIVTHFAISKCLAGLGMCSFAQEQFRQRLGFFWRNEDHWWEITRVSQENVAAEIAELIQSRLQPIELGIQTEDDLIRLWESGRSPGLTRDQRLISLACYYSITKRFDALRNLRDREGSRCDERNKKSVALQIISEML